MPTSSRRISNTGTSKKWLAVLLLLLLNAIYVIFLTTTLWLPGGGANDKFTITFDVEQVLDNNNDVVSQRSSQVMLEETSAIINTPMMSTSTDSKYMRDDTSSNSIIDMDTNVKDTTSIDTNTNLNTNIDTSKFDMETAILIATNLIPSAPKIDIIQEVIESLFTQLKGLSPNAPVFIIVDHLPPESHVNKKHIIRGQEKVKAEAKLEQYALNLLQAYKNQPNFHIIVNKVQHHLGGNLNKTLHILNDKTLFLYFVQHDFKFVKEVNHTAIIHAMKTYPHRLKNVRFNKKTNVSKRRGDHCWAEPDALLKTVGANFTKTSGWSDNNHFASVQFYKSLMEEIKSVNRPLEAPMQHKMYELNNCSKWAQHVYGAPWQGRHILHLDGREGSVTGLHASSPLAVAGNVTVSSGVGVGGVGVGVDVGVKNATKKTGR
jgi:hypothetical protein